MRITGKDTDSFVYIGTHNGLSLSDGGFIDWDIYDNYFKGWGYTTFSFTNHNRNGYMTEGIRFYNNYIEHEGYNYGRGFGGHQHVAQVKESNPIEIFNNIIHEPNNPSRTGIAYARIYNNLFIGGRGEHATTSANTFQLYGYPDKPSYKTKVYNNIFANSDYAGMYWTIRSGHDPIEDCEVINNIFYNNGVIQFRVNNEENKIINTTVNNNIFYSDKTNKVIRVYDKFMDVAEFNALDGTGHQQWNPSGNIQKDPLFVDPENNDFRLKANSPAIGTGINVGLTHDRAGNLYKDTPSIGPYEYYP
jgi:hypothetical protein